EAAHLPKPLTCGSSLSVIEAAHLRKLAVSYRSPLSCRSSQSVIEARSVAEARLPGRSLYQLAGSPAPRADSPPPPRLRAAGPVSAMPDDAAHLLDRDLLVDQAEIDPLPSADEEGGHIEHDRQHVHAAHVPQRGRLVHEVEVVFEPLVEVEDE